MGLTQSFLDEVPEKRSKIRKLINLLDKNYKNKFIHISSIPISIDNFFNTNKIDKSRFRGSPIYYNPFGLWFSCGTDWIKWVKKSKDRKRTRRNSIHITK